MSTTTSLERRREQLALQVAELQFDLGGLAYEMAIRDHFRLDVLTRRAAELQRADAELAEVERHARRRAALGGRLVRGVRGSALARSRVLLAMRNRIAGFGV